MVLESDRGKLFSKNIHPNENLCCRPWAIVLFETEHKIINYETQFLRVSWA